MVTCITLFMSVPKHCMAYIVMVQSYSPLKFTNTSIARHQDSTHLPQIAFHFFIHLDQTDFVPELILVLLVYDVLKILVPLDPFNFPPDNNG